MIESNNPEIDVNQLMERIRAEVARRRDLGLLRRNGSGDAVSTVLPQVHFLAPLPPMVSPRRIDVKEGRLTSILQRATIPDEPAFNSFRYGAKDWRRV